jgi:hypothetical protein
MHISFRGYDVGKMYIINCWHVSQCLHIVLAFIGAAMVDLSEMSQSCFLRGTVYLLYCLKFILSELWVVWTRTTNSSIYYLKFCAKFKAKISRLHTKNLGNVLPQYKCSRPHNSQKVLQHFKVGVKCETYYTCYAVQTLFCFTSAYSDNWKDVI